MGKFAFAMFVILMILKLLGFGISWLIVFLPIILLLVFVTCATVILGFIAWIFNKLG